MIVLKNLSLRRGSKLLLDQVSVTINAGEHVALVGRNGAGKSSLLALLNRTLHEDAGEYLVPAQWRMAQVAQDMPETPESATAFVLQGDSRLTGLRAALARAEDGGDGMAIAQAHSDLADAGAHDATARAQALILGLGFRVAELEQPVNSFSGGWRMRLQLARALICPCDLLLLDEPTNHLDLDALVWLESWLARYAGTLITISHDREFLDAVADVTLHIENARITRYGGNYSRFEALRAQQMELQQASYAKQQDRVAQLQKFITRFKAKASKAKQAQSRVKALERMEKIAPVLADAEFGFDFKEPAQLPNPMLSITDAVFGYAGAGVDGSAHTILRHVGRSVLAGQRIGILGANGQGKSTLVKTIARQMKVLAGRITEGRGLRIGYFAQQELDLLRPADNPLEHMLRLARDMEADGRESGREQELRNHLGSFNFSGDMARQAVGSMSGGEKARLVLAMIVWQRPNLLLLDEPTNHLDLVTREALSMALNGFEGTLLLVSHDRALLRAVCDEFWLVGRGAVAPFDGDLDDYQRYLLDEAKRLREPAARSARTADSAEAPAVPAPTSAPIAALRDGREQRRLDALARQQHAEKTRPLKTEIGQIDARLVALFTERSALEQRLAQEALPAAEIAECGRRLKAVADETARLEERWLEISCALEALLAAA
ncbi:ABC-F family ATP-binding cassette domain-containing protein [Verminephrobacter aporrectodeae]|uniref:ABC-F family ATP-binding cassette domain-containing protein n=1 Tax=Verminephrobacter aporrectodeae TaxID=1110389 RepID=UPI0002376247|nr:ATP-binding cassette domain-containing protein [Verminephrobacter aporrectodeae]